MADERRQYDIEAQPVEHGEYTFRSITEVRWAYFFEGMGWEYEYEKQTFSLRKGVGYLPDFYLPQFGFWAEVKPNTFLHVEADKCWQVTEQTQQPCLLLAGAPHMGLYRLFRPFEGGIKEGWTSLVLMADVFRRFSKVYDPYGVEALVDAAHARPIPFFRSMKSITQTMRWPWEED